MKRFSLFDKSERLTEITDKLYRDKILDYYRQNQKSIKLTLADIYLLNSKKYVPIDALEMNWLRIYSIHELVPLALDAVGMMLEDSKYLAKYSYLSLTNNKELVYNKNEWEQLSDLESDICGSYLRNSHKVDFGLEPSCFVDKKYNVKIPDFCEKFWIYHMGNLKSLLWYNVSDSAAKDKYLYHKIRKDYEKLNIDFEFEDYYLFEKMTNLEFCVALTEILESVYKKTTLETMMKNAMEQHFFVCEADYVRCEDVEKPDSKYIDIEKYNFELEEKIKVAINNRESLSLFEYQMFDSSDEYMSEYWLSDLIYIYANSPLTFSKGKILKYLYQNLPEEIEKCKKEERKMYIVLQYLSLQSAELFNSYNNTYLQKAYGQFYEIYDNPELLNDITIEKHLIKDKGLREWAESNLSNSRVRITQDMANVTVQKRMLECIMKIYHK